MDRLEEPVDRKHLARHTFGDRELEHEVLELFLGQSQLYLERLRQAADGESWRMAAHTLKGSARGIGAWGVAERAEDAEAAGPASRERALCAVETELDSARRFIDRLLAEP